MAPTPRRVEVINALTLRPDVRAGGVAVMGQCRGSELALLAGALLDDVRAGAAFMPSGISWSTLS